MSKTEPSKRKNALSHSDGHEKSVIEKGRFKKIYIKFMNFPGENVIIAINRPETINKNLSQPLTTVIFFTVFKGFLKMNIYGS